MTRAVRVAVTSSRHAAVADAAGAAERDRAAIGAGIPSRALMQRAGAAAAAEIVGALRRRAARVASSSPRARATTAATAGSSRARCMRRASRVRVVECVAAKTPDAIAERALAIADGVPVDSSANSSSASGAERLIVDALLGTGLHVSEPPRGEIAKAVAIANARRRARRDHRRASTCPTGLDAPPAPLRACCTARSPSPSAR